MDTDKVIALARKHLGEEMAYAAARRRDTAFKDFEFAFLVTWGLGGTTVHNDYSKDSTSQLQGYGFNEAEVAEIDRLGIPFIDKRCVREDILVAASICGPLAPSRPNETDPAPWHALSAVPVPVLAAWWSRHGAIVRNVTPDFNALSNMGERQREILASLETNVAA